MSPHPFDNHHVPLTSELPTWCELCPTSCKQRQILVRKGPYKGHSVPRSRSPRGLAPVGRSVMPPPECGLPRGVAGDADADAPVPVPVPVRAILHLAPLRCELREVCQAPNCKIARVAGWICGRLAFDRHSRTPSRTRPGSSHPAWWSRALCAVRFRGVGVVGAIVRVESGAGAGRCTWLTAQAPGSSAGHRPPRQVGESAGPGRRYIPERRAPRLPREWPRPDGRYIPGGRAAPPGRLPGPSPRPEASVESHPPREWPRPARRYTPEPRSRPPSRPRASPYWRAPPKTFSPPRHPRRGHPPLQGGNHHGYHSAA